MTAELRTYLKQAVSDAVLARELADGRPRCGGCGCDYDQFLAGCKHCWGRKRSRKRRGHDA